jgi:hypothetical protein
MQQITFEQLCYTRDEGRSLGLGLQDQGPNYRKLRWHNGRGGERCGKRRERTRQVSLGKANASEPLMTYRKGFLDVAETRGGPHPWDGARRKPADWPGGNRYLGGAIPTTGSCVERGPRCEGRPPKRRNRKEQSTDAGHRDGRVRSSVEAQ